MLLLLTLNNRADIYLDLTKEIPEEHCNKADLVCELGTLEHIFDIKTAIENMDKILKKGGVILHVDVVSFYQHGYYNFNPMFFSSLCKGSGYKEIFKTMQLSIYNPFFIIDRRNLPKYVRYLFYYTNLIFKKIKIAFFRFNLPFSRNGENLSYKIFNFYLGHFGMTKSLLYVCAYVKNSNSLKIPYDVWD
jgi:SAM-dependent methyltransferase|tara:strand:+ start:44 stop:613 length:570 start_codon:yes stop_codon:yes gene_type:complete